METLKTIYTNIEGTHTFIDDMTQKGLSKREGLLKVYYEKLLEKIRYQNYDPYFEQYLFPLVNLYNIIDGFNVVGPQSNWEITAQDAGGHDNALR